MITNFQADMNQNTFKIRGEFPFPRNALCISLFNMLKLKGRIAISSNEKCDIINFVQAVGIPPPVDNNLRPNYLHTFIPISFFIQSCFR